MKTNGTPMGIREKEYTAAHRRKKKWLTAVTCLAAIVVFCTTYALILPAITLEKGQGLECSYPVHVHEESCYDKEENLTCGYANYVVHTHQGDYCYDADGNLICKLPQVEIHEHTSSCYEEQSVLVCEETENAGHVHSDDCRTRVRGELVCGQDEGHAHDDSCYSPVKGELECQEEHEHTDDCYAWTDALTCGMEEGGHQHSDDCYSWSEELTCNMEAGDGAHQHSDDCYEPQTVLTCEKPEVILHTHEDGCWENILNENDQVISLKLICEQLQVEAHQHDETCIGVSDPRDDAAPTSVEADEIPEDMLTALAALSIYPGTQTMDAGGNEVWTVYDAAGESNATIKATVTLPAGTVSQEGHYLYIREVQQDEGYYPNSDVLEEVVGKYNDVQCYAIHWVYVYQEDGEWKYELQTVSVLGGANGENDDAPSATITIEYLKESAYLQGHMANRKLQVYNSRNAEGTELESAHSTLTAVTAAEDAYTGFTFQTNRAGPYVFASKWLYEGYVTNVSVKSITDGTAPFDANNDPGNDSSDNNKIVRSYDKVSYLLGATFGARSNESVQKTGKVWFEMTMQADITQASFDIEQITWAEKNYVIEYLDENGKVILTRDSDGTYHDANGGVVTDLNRIVTYDSTGDENSYTSPIVTQRLRGWQEVTHAQNVLAGEAEFSAGIQVLNAANDSTIQPTFRVWFDGNEDNYGSESSGEGSGIKLAEIVTDNEKTVDAVTVSAAARFNLELMKAGNLSYKAWFDSSTGKEIGSSNTDSYTVGSQTVTGAQLYTLLEALATLEENRDLSNPEEFRDAENACAEQLGGLNLSDYAAVFSNIRYGRLTGYGITLQVYNNVSASAGTASKGFRGISLPVGAVTFDLALSSSATPVGGVTLDQTQYYAQLWEYKENSSAHDYGNQKRNMYWANLPATKYASWAAPYNADTGGTNSCYNGGSWILGTTNADGSYPFTVSGYDFNFLFNGLMFPTHKAGNGSATTGYNSYIGSFSAGYVQVLNVFPRIQSAEFKLNTDVTVNNLTVSTVDQSIAPDQNDPTGYAHETKTGDNRVNDSIPLYSTGGMTKANAFCNAACFDKNNSSFDGYFLGTYFWGTSYDCSAFAGQQITLVGAARIGAGDNKIRHMNLLQLFDSAVLSVDTSKKSPYVVSGVTGAVEGKTTILYAADPLYPEGYNTNGEDGDVVTQYMSRVREEDLIYYESLDKLEADGYTCIGVLAELRNWAIDGEGGYNTVLKIPMLVSQEEEFLSKTVCTVNTVRIWTNASDMGSGTVSWKDGVYNSDTGKNSVEGYTPVNASSLEHYSGEVANGTAYTKTKYANGTAILEAGNDGGYVYGSSLLILGYKSEVDITVDNRESGSPSYDVAKGDNTVNYRLTGIIAKPGDVIGNAQDTTTGLTILSRMDTPGEDEDGDKDEDAVQRIAVADNSYQMVAASTKMKLVDESGNELAAVTIGSDPNAPTTVRYWLYEDDGKTYKEYTISVYAQRSTNGDEVTFQVANATVGVSLPDITFDALIDPQTVENNDKIHATAYISGTSDVRAYSTTAGNKDSVSIGIVKLGGVLLVKSVEEEYIELNGTITYTVSYTNTGDAAIDFYLYDLLPNTDDIRESQFTGNVTLRAVSAALSGEDENFTVNIQFYYSKQEYAALYNEVKRFGAVQEGAPKSEAGIAAMLQDEDWFLKLGSITSENSHQFVGDPELSDKTDSEREQEMRDMTGIYAVIKGLGAGKTLSITLTVQAENNTAGNLYRNIANSWQPQTSGDNENDALTSNRVSTAALSRTISGVVWYDSNLNGVRDTGEGMIPGVTCTLFWWDEDQKQYVAVTGGDGPNGRLIAATGQDAEGRMVTQEIGKDETVSVTTGADGSYRFENLAAGQYIVAFSGDALSKYTGSTVYQVNGSNDSVTNDGVALASGEGRIETVVSGLELGNGYKYAIAYSLSNTTANALPLHTISQLQNGQGTLTNYVELYDHQDLGLVIEGYELPKTGGAGTTLFTIGGLLLMAGACGCGYGLRRRCGRRAGR